MTAVRAEIQLVIPRRGGAGFPWGHSTAFAPNTQHAHLHKQFSFTIHCWRVFFFFLRHLCIANSCNLPKTCYTLQVWDKLARDMMGGSSKSTFCTVKSATGENRINILIYKYTKQIYSTHHSSAFPPGDIRQRNKNQHSVRSSAVCTFPCLPLRPQTWQNLQRLQHQFFLFSFCGRSSTGRQNRWKGSQHIWQNIIWKTRCSFPWPTSSLKI